MRKHWIVAVVSALTVIGLAPGFSGAAASGEDIVAALDTPDGVEYLTKDEISTESNHVAECLGNEAPSEFYCENDEDVRSGGLLHACVGEPGYTGTVESRLQYDGGERMWACTYEDGVLQDTESAGDWPSTGDEIFHDCYSYFQDTVYLLYVDGLLAQQQPTGAPGGQGPWGCYVDWGY